MDRREINVHYRKYNSGETRDTEEEFSVVTEQNNQSSHIENVTNSQYTGKRFKVTKPHLETSLESVRRLADGSSDSDKESDTREAPSNKLKMRPIIKISRIDEVDISLILDKRTREQPRKNVEDQFDQRSNKTIRKDEEKMRFIGKETRKGFHHHKKTAIKKRKQATWRIKMIEGLTAEEAKRLRRER